MGCAKLYLVTAKRLRKRRMGEAAQKEVLTLGGRGEGRQTKRKTTKK